MTAFDKWIRDLAYTDFPSDLLRAGETVGTRPYAAEIEEMLAPQRTIGASAVFCVGDVPTVCFVDGSTLATDRERRVEQIRQRVWNQNLASVVLIVDSNCLTGYSVTDRAAEPDLLPHGEAHQHGRWSAYEIQSGFIKDRLSSWFSPDARVDQRLLVNLREAVQRLEKDGLTSTESEALMAQVIFLCYLEQRGIVGDDYRNIHRLDVLEGYVERGDGAGVDQFLRNLGRDFNGDFLSSTDGGAPRWATLSREQFSTVGLFLDAVDLETGQGSFWRYDFSHIPVELISGIYETLLRDRQGTLGAYYTPRHLANLVTEQALSRFDDPSKCTIYDGACGSGILLTTAFRRILRFVEVREARKLRLPERIALMRQHIFGNDIDETSCWITAFSLYLSLLEGLDPADIARLQTDENLKLPRLVGPTLNIQKGTRRGDFFAKANPYAASRHFDVFICNPPWRESDDEEEPTWETWCKEQVPPYPIGRRQIAAGFAYRASQSVQPNGVIALIMPLNLVIGATSQSHEFRKRWLTDVRFERIINFADVRRLLFPASKHPCAVVVARPRPAIEGEIALAEENVEYWTPKTDVSLALGRLALHADDQKFLTAKEIYEKPYRLISSYWGEKRDLDLLRRLQTFGTLYETMESQPRPWMTGKGFHKANQSNPDRDLGILRNLRILQADRIPTGYPVIGGDAQLERVKDLFDVVASPGGRNGRLYMGPRVLFTDGLTEGFSVRAVYSDRPFCFQSSVGAIGGPLEDADLLKFLTVYLRSPLASYLLVMTGYSVISERPRVALDDIEAFPFCAPEMHAEPSVAAAIVKSVASEMDRLSAEPEWVRDHAYTAVRQGLDEKVLDYFRLSRADKILVSDTVKFVARSIQPADYEGLTTPLLERASAEEIGRYVEVLGSELARWRDDRQGVGSLRVQAVVERGGFFGGVRVTITEENEDRTEVVSSDLAFRNLLSELHGALNNQVSQLSEDKLFKLPNVMVMADDAFYFVKPLRRRFWLARTALSDADHIVQTVQAAAWNRTLA